MKSNLPFILSNTTILYYFKSSFFTHSTSKRRQLLAKKQRVEDEEQERRAKLNANNQLYWNEGRHADVNYLLAVLRFDDFNSNILHKNIRHKQRISL
jgi:tmRNA-binding protein